MTLDELIQAIIGPLLAQSLKQQSQQPQLSPFASAAKTGEGTPDATGVWMGTPPPMSPDAAASRLYGMTGIPDIQQGATAMQRGDYLPGFGQAAYGVLNTATLAAPAAPIGKAVVGGGRAVLEAVTRAGEAAGAKDAGSSFDSLLRQMALEQQQKQASTSAKMPEWADREKRKQEAWEQVLKQVGLPPSWK
jgi:hypothetical protein